MAVIQPYFIPDISRGSSAFATGWNTFLKERTKMNYKMMDMHLKKQDPSYLFQQMEVIDKNIIELEKMKNDLFEMDSRNRSNAARDYARSMARGYGSSGGPKSEFPSLELFQDASESNLKQAAKTAAGQYMNKIINQRQPNQTGRAAIGASLAQALTTKMYKDLTGKNLTPDILDVVRPTLTKYLIQYMDDELKAQNKDIAEEAKSQLYLSQGISYDSRGPSGSINKLDEEIEKSKKSLKLLANKVQIKGKAPDRSKLKELAEQGMSPDVAARIIELGKKIEAEEAKRAQIGTQAEIQMQRFQDMSPFEPFKRNFVSETAFQASPSQEARQDLISQQLDRPMKTMSAAYPDLEFNKPYETAGGMLVGVTQVGGEERPFTNIRGEEQIYSPGESGFNSIDRLLKELSLVQKEQAQMVE
jgi:hypothetical protein